MKRGVRSAGFEEVECFGSHEGEELTSESRLVRRARL